MKVFGRLATVLLLCFSACRSEAPRQSITVFAAASLTTAFEDIASSFEKAYPQYRIRYNFAGSQQLVQQLAQGAPADILATADTFQMNRAQRSGIVQPNGSVVFATTRLVLVVSARNPGRIHSASELTRPKLQIVVAAPEVPAGRYTDQFLAAYARTKGRGWMDSVRSNILSYEPDVRSVAAKIRMGEADAGFVYEVDAQGMDTIALPDSVTPHAYYVIARTRAARAGADAFVRFVMSPQGQSLLKRHAFRPAPTSRTNRPRQRTTSRSDIQQR